MATTAADDTNLSNISKNYNAKRITLKDTKRRIGIKPLKYVLEV